MTPDEKLQAIVKRAQKLREKADEMTGDAAAVKYSIALGLMDVAFMASQLLRRAEHLRWNEPRLVESQWEALAQAEALLDSV